MAGNSTVLRLDHLTYRGNSKDTRYGWLRLTPAFSVNLVQGRLPKFSDSARVLDPFCGTGTTALVCSQEGFHCDSTDINPFLLWLAEAKCSTYSADDIENARALSEKVVAALRDGISNISWIPPLHQIEKWWEPAVLDQLGKIWAVLQEQEKQINHRSKWLMRLSFCRTMIELAKVSFSHQSMSFKKPGPTLLLDFKGEEPEVVVTKWVQAVGSILAAARTEVGPLPRFSRCDARNLESNLSRDSFDCVITSPPYPNRMSYIRELRPYMYWLGYLMDGKGAGELDWEAIGGTWGCATSNLTKWHAPKEEVIPYKPFRSILSNIARTSPLLSRYVHKYFCDMVLHSEGLFKVVKSGGVIHYIVGNSKFYNVILPVQEIFASMFSAVGFMDVKIETIRKRTSKKELFEYIVSARKL